MRYVYIIQSIDAGRFYVGSTDDVDRCLKEHNQGLSFATQPYKPWKLRKVEAYPTATEARKREIFIKKKKSRKILEKIINTEMA